MNILSNYTCIQTNSLADNGVRFVSKMSQPNQFPIYGNYVPAQPYQSMMPPFSMQGAYMPAQPIQPHVPNLTMYPVNASAQQMQQQFPVQQPGQFNPMQQKNGMPINGAGQNPKQPNDQNQKNDQNQFQPMNQQQAQYSNNTQAAGAVTSNGADTDQSAQSQQMPQVSQPNNNNNSAMNVPGAVAPPLNLNINFQPGAFPSAPQPATQQPIQLQNQFPAQQSMPMQQFPGQQPMPMQQFPAQQSMPFQYQAQQPMQAQFPAQQSMQPQFPAQQPMQNQFSTQQPMQPQFPIQQPMQNQFSAQQPMQSSLTAQPLMNDAMKTALAYQNLSSIPDGKLVLDQLAITTEELKKQRELSKTFEAVGANEQLEKLRKFAVIQMLQQESLSKIDPAERDKKEAELWNSVKDNPVLLQGFRAMMNRAPNNDQTDQSRNSPPAANGQVSQSAGSTMSPPSVPPQNQHWQNQPRNEQGRFINQAQPQQPQQNASANQYYPQQFYQPQQFPGQQMAPGQPQYDYYAQQQFGSYPQQNPLQAGPAQAAIQQPANTFPQISQGMVDLASRVTNTMKNTMNPLADNNNGNNNNSGNRNQISQEKRGPRSSDQYERNADDDLYDEFGSSIEEGRQRFRNVMKNAYPSLGEKDTSIMSWLTTVKTSDSFAEEHPVTKSREKDPNSNAEVDNKTFGDEVINNPFNRTVIKQLLMCDEKGVDKFFAGAARKAVETAYKIGDSWRQHPGSLSLPVMNRNDGTRLDVKPLAVPTIHAGFDTRVMQGYGKVFTGDNMNLAIPNLNEVM